MKLYIRSQDTGLTEINPLASFLEEKGLDGVQLVTYKTFKDRFLYREGELNQEKCFEVKNKLGGRIPLIGAYFNPVHSDKEKVERGKAVFKEYLTFANDLGGCYVGSETGSYNDDKWTYNPLNRTESAFWSVVETFRELDSFSRTLEFGGRVAVEGAAGHVCFDVKTLARLKKEIDSPDLKIIFDLYNYLDESNYDSYLDILDEGLATFKDDILLFHMKDCVFLDGKLTQVPVGTGQLDYKAILTKIKRHNKNADLVLEGTVNPYIESGVQHIRKLWLEV